MCIAHACGGLDGISIRPTATGNSSKCEVMKQSLKSSSTASLIERFFEIGVAQSRALDFDDTALFNRLYDQKTAVLDELKRRPGDQRRALNTLYAHSSLQVRLNAAAATLAITPEEARSILRAIRDTDWMPQASHAADILRNLEEGILRPT